MPTFALNFYSPIVADQLRTGRKTATIRLGDKSAKYRKGMIVTVLVGARYGQREKVFDAVIDKVDVKPLSDLSPREIEHDNPEIRRVDEFVDWLSKLYNRPVSDRRHDHRDPLLADRGDDVLNVGEPHGSPRAPSFRARTDHASLAPGRQSWPPVATARSPEGEAWLHPRPSWSLYRPGRRIGPPKRSFGRSCAPHSSHSTWKADGSRASQTGQRATSAVLH